MPTLIIDTHKELPPFPFMFWCKECIFKVLSNSGFDLNYHYERNELGSGRIEFIQKDKHNDPK